MDATTQAFAEFLDATNEQVKRLSDVRTDILHVADDTTRSILRGEPLYSPEQHTYAREFKLWVSNPAAHKERISQVVNELHLKDISVASNIGGGYGVPKQLAARIESYARPACPLLDPAICGAIEVQTNDYHAPVGRADNVFANRAGETSTRAATSTSTLADVKPSWGTYYAYVGVTNWAREDIGDRLETFLAEEFAAQVGAQLMADILTGDGNGKVSGLTANAPVTTTDAASPMRANNSLQYTFLTGATVILGDIENLLSQFYEQYIQADDFRWIMRPSTWTKTYCVGRTGTGSVEAPFLQPVFQPSLYGRLVALSSAMPLIASNAFAIAAGAWKRGYLLVTRGPASLTIDEVTTPGMCHYHYRQRFGGCVKASPAIKLLKFATS